jgi:hypothetical protein
MNDYEYLREFATTDRQKTVLDTLKSCKTLRAAADSMKITERGMAYNITRLKAKAAKQGVTENSKNPLIPPGYMAQGTSTLYDADGNAKLTWVKTQRDSEVQAELIREGIKEAFDEYKGKSIKVKKNKLIYNDDLLCVIPIGDAHFGMQAWGEECGEDFDLKIAERDLMAAMTRLIDSAPPAKTCLIAEMGDFLHRNDNLNRSMSGNALDCDSRFIKMMRVATKVLIHSINEALIKFNKVILRNVVGNHAPEAEQMLGLALQLYYSNNKRVVVDTSANKFWYHQFGKVAIGLHHGDKIKTDQLPLLMAADSPEMWGSTEHRYFYIGHLHHKQVKEHPGCIVEIFNTLAGKDAWHYASGYRGKQNISLIVHHKEYGEIERITKDISMIRAESEGE